MEGYGCSHGLLGPTHMGETEKASVRLRNSPIALPRGCGIGVKRGIWEPLKLAGPMGSCSWPGSPRAPAGLGGGWGGQTPGSPLVLLPSPAQELRFNWRWGWAHKHLLHVDPSPACTAGQCWGVWAAGHAAATNPVPCAHVMGTLVVGRGVAGHPRLSGMHKAKVRSPHGVASVTEAR